MEVHFSPEQEAALSKIAAHAGMDTKRLVQGAALRLVEEAAQFLVAVREGIAAADRGDFVEDDAVVRWLELRERS